MSVLMAELACIGCLATCIANTDTAVSLLYLSSLYSNLALTPVGIMGITEAASLYRLSALLIDTSRVSLDTLDVALLAKSKRLVSDCLSASCGCT